MPVTLIAAGADHNVLAIYQMYLGTKTYDNTVEDEKRHNPRSTQPTKN